MNKLREYGKKAMTTRELMYLMLILVAGLVIAFVVYRTILSRLTA